MTNTFVVTVSAGNIYHPRYAHSSVLLLAFFKTFSRNNYWLVCALRGARYLLFAGCVVVHWLFDTGIRVLRSRSINLNSVTSIVTGVSLVSHACAARASTTVLLLGNTHDSPCVAHERTEPLSQFEEQRIEQWQMEWAEKAEERALELRKSLEAILKNPDNPPEKAIQKKMKVIFVYSRLKNCR